MSQTDGHRQTDGQTDRQTEIAILKAAWSQLKMYLDSVLLLHCNGDGSLLSQRPHRRSQCDAVHMVHCVTLCRPQQENPTRHRRAINSKTVCRATAMCEYNIVGIQCCCTHHILRLPQHTKDAHPMGTRRNYNRDVVLTSKWRYFCVVCPLGNSFPLWVSSVNS